MLWPYHLYLARWQLFISIIITGTYRCNTGFSVLYRKLSSYFVSWQNLETSSFLAGMCGQLSLRCHRVHQGPTCSKTTFHVSYVNFSSTSSMAALYFCTDGTDIRQERESTPSSTPTPFSLESNSAALLSGHIAISAKHTDMLGGLLFSEKMLLGTPWYSPGDWPWKVVGVGEISTRCFLCVSERERDSETKDVCWGGVRWVCLIRSLQKNNYRRQ